MEKLKSIFRLAENLSLVFIKLDTELCLAKPQLVYFSCGLVLILGAVDTFLIHIYILYFIIFLTTFQKALVTKKTVKCDEPARIVSMRILLKIKEVLIAKIVSFKKIVPTGDPVISLSREILITLPFLNGMD